MYFYVEMSNYSLPESRPKSTLGKFSGFCGVNHATMLHCLSHNGKYTVMIRKVRLYCFKIEFCFSGNFWLSAVASQHKLSFARCLAAPVGAGSVDGGPAVPRARDRGHQRTRTWCCVAAAAAGCAGGCCALGFSAWKRCSDTRLRLFLRKCFMPLFFLRVVWIWDFCWSIPKLF